MSRRLKTSRKTAQENFQVDNSTGHLQLLGTVPDTINVFPFETIFDKDTKFHYLAQNACTGEVKDTEIGIGHVEVRNGSSYIVRDEALLFFYGDIQRTPACKLLAFNKDSDADCLIVTSFIPKDVSSLLPDKNSIIVSDESFAPATITLDDNSLLVSLNGVLCSITFKEFAKHLKKYL